jgi:drug/metabolite transporter (DMT)-like permease
MLTPAHLAIAMSLLAALLWGGGDFAGGFATRRASPLQVIALAQGMDAVLLYIAILIRHAPMPSRAALLWGFTGGVSNGLGLICLYTALAIAEMGLAAAIAGLLTAGLPVLVSACVEGAPRPRQLAGFVLAGISVWRITSAPMDISQGAPRSAQSRSLWLATFAGIGFGFFLVFSRQASKEAILWPLLASRVAGTLVALGLLATVRISGFPDGPVRTTLSWKPITARLLWLGITAGLLDVAGNLFYMAATRMGRMDVAAVLASLYPAATIVLAMVLLRERATRAQALGMGLAMLAVLLIAS